MKFSIAIPAYKGKFLRTAIESCLLQTYQEYEIVVVDDASPERLDEIVGSFADERVRYFRNEKNCGALNVVDNWNICLSYCTGDYVICMGDDDRLLPNCLTEYAALIEKFPDLNVYHAWTEIIDENGNFVKLLEPRPVFESCMSLIWNRWNGRSQFIGDFCFRISDLRENGGFFKLPEACGSDDVSVVRAARLGGIANTQTVCFQYRNSNHTISKGVKDFSYKLKAKREEKAWYLDFLSLCKYEASSLEGKFLKAVVNELEDHFKQECKYLIKLDFCNNKSRFFRYFFDAALYGLTKKDVLVAWIKSLWYRVK